ncbi:sulfite exporter TauE/SafE family protein [Aliivibrio finisterrensis]|jgi:uncharacterized membrane protein YfcA|uniref:Probable membrane transporter protein n=1 Tax=Aliivibrio finisterrensis TaxID=511998 RepID=A0A4Q5KXG5_9GAMM|nr:MULTISPECIES: sulfite exporter TauE/SafE family protein [Aliivibrio]MDD9177467.1 sulfite exporter TauE/SafE family protein [Aliivibrio sp. A6]RYU46656.1 sulfite exporter TauE/SafE family protein [Aliivibrio finisterrensis]RYU54102.1 sulfite exporter TauE/SafE family protein [Aliivibrio finisterrensis]RYU56124.1 sulfite exporter TauE/SafE family protein [Aliivibrio finisterrensis]RYU61063.1 sulfite exporter TauE/SafE family protein [Aliivibrio finisterrensis]
MSVDFWSIFALYLALGSVVGVMAGLLGIGGGLLVVPALLWLLPQAGIDATIAMQMALGTSLATIIFTSSSSAWNHLRLGNVEVGLIKSLAPGVILGGFIGSYLTELIPAHYLPKVFGVIVLLLALQMLLALKFTATRIMPSPLKVATSGGVIGIVSSLAGIGGGSLTVPYLSFHGVEMRKAIGSSSLCGTLIAIAGMIGFVIHGVNVENLPPMSLGYVYLPALCGISFTSILTTRVGAKLASHLPTPTLKKIFAVFLVFIGSKMFLG